MRRPGGLAVTLSDVSPTRFVPGVVAPAPPGPKSLFVLARGLDVLVRFEGDRPAFPAFEAVAAWGDLPHYLGDLDGAAIFTAALLEQTPPEPYKLVPARTLFGALDEAAFSVAGRAIAVSEWDVTHRFCGKCGTPTEVDPKERARRCPRCESAFYPRVSPAVIVLVERGDQVLLARGANFPRPWFSTLAGFVEPGESFEEAVAREVKEEVGVDVKNLRYFGSQPWPFGRSVMVGFNAEWAGGEIAADGVEIAEAHWYRRDELPNMPPKLSIARNLIDEWLARGK